MCDTVSRWLPYRYEKWRFAISSLLTPIAQYNDFYYVSSVKENNILNA